MTWNFLTAEDQLQDFYELSSKQDIEAVIVFKHSTRCSISMMAKDRLERKWDLDPVNYPAYYVDVISSRVVSNQLADVFAVEHQSPQLLIIKNGKCVYNASHSEIAFPEIQEFLNTKN